MGKFLFSFLLPQKLNRRTNVVLAYNVTSIAAVAELELQNFKLRTNVK